MANPTEAESYSFAAFAHFPCAVKFGEKILGGTNGPVSITPEIEEEEVTCNQAKGKAIAKWVKKFKYRISATFMEPDNVLNEVFGLGANITKDIVGKNLYADAKTLVLSAIGANMVLTFHSAVGKVTKYDIDGENWHGVEIEFETTECGDAEGKIYTFSNAADATGT